MGQMIELVAKDHFKNAAYVAHPSGKAKGAVVVLQEIFGVNAHIKAVADMAERGDMQMNGLKGELKEKFVGTVAVLPTRTFEQDLTLNLGGRDIRRLPSGQLKA